MPRVLGKAGRFVSEEATRKRNAIWTRAALALAAFGALWGMMVGSSFRVMTAPLWGRGSFSIVILLAIWLTAKWSFRRLDELERDREKWLRGAAGEMKVGLILEGLPDEFHVINDLPTRDGNLDHVVIGPTGVFVLETKDWRGIVSEDGKGELKWSGGALKAPSVKGLVRRTMETREGGLTLAPGVDAFFQAVFVFTSAWVEAKFKTTGWAHCVRDDRLRTYLLDEKGRRKLSRAEVRLIAGAFSWLARMQPEFAGESAGQEGAAEAVEGLPLLANAR